MNNEKERLLQAFSEWITFVTDLAKFSERIWNQSVAAGKWSVREVVAHIWRWDDYFYEEAIAKAAEGMPLTVKHLDYDQFNENAKAYGKTTSIAELTHQAVQSRKRIIDTIGKLSNEQYDASYIDADGHPFQMSQYMNDFIWHDQHHIQPIKRLLHFRIEEMSLNGWPALQTVVYDGWLLRFADGYTKRSNSINPIYSHTLELDAKIRACEKRYEKEGIRTTFKITPFSQPASLDEELSSRGYALIDHTVVKTVHLSDVLSPSHADVWLESKPTEAWLDAITVFSGLTDKQRAITRKMLDQSPLDQCFALLHDNGIPVACGFAVMEDGYVGLYDIVTDPGNRSRGYGEQLILHLLQWGKGRGSKEGYLLVVKNNAPANRLYDKIGFVPQYEYWYRVSQKQQ
ncbi:GNAT family N-acetyltransferase [Paenibacillus sp. PL91]|uniref:GNAT family N-acetyltransferase n=1 Tax=Paenibacillus sp. PL91 TaxID=2729538 RepID=UPI00145D7BAB|nr:GNAT family N-acetyltransferase [Paenibacillus sp. PL91]MBC9198477.1 GNAT family N-acetyltransferase [Paenibacillus sp. PL91]